MLSRAEVEAGGAESVYAVFLIRSPANGHAPELAATVVLARRDEIPGLATAWDDAVAAAAEAEVLEAELSRSEDDGDWPLEFREVR